MKKNLIIFLAVICMAVPVFNDIDAFVKQNSKLLVHDLVYSKPGPENPGLLIHRFYMLIGFFPR